MHICMYMCVCVCVCVCVYVYIERRAGCDGGQRWHSKAAHGAPARAHIQLLRRFSIYLLYWDKSTNTD